MAHDQGAERPERVTGGGDQPGGHGRIGEVAGQQLDASAHGAQLLGEQLDVGVLPEHAPVVVGVEGEREVVAVLGEAARDRGADPAPSADAGEQGGAGKGGGAVHGCTLRSAPPPRPALFVPRHRLGRSLRLVTAAHVSPSGRW
jgi:hypothetical protein